MDRLREVFTYVCAAMGILALILAVYQAANDKLQSALVLFLVFGLCGAYVFISQIKAFKVWQIEVQLREKLNEADAILAQLRQVAIVNAKAAYRQVGTAGRFGGVNDAIENQRLVDDIDDQLNKLGVPEPERRVLTQTYLQISGFDFYMLFVKVLERYFQFKTADLVGRLNKDPENHALKDELDRWRKGQPTFRWNNSLFSQLATYSLADELGRITTAWLNEQDQKAVDTFRNQILSLWSDSQKRGRPTKEAAEYYDRYHDLGGQDKKIIELFGFNPSALR